MMQAILDFEGQFSCRSYNLDQNVPNSYSNYRVGNGTKEKMTHNKGYENAHTSKMAHSNQTFLVPLIGKS